MLVLVRIDVHHGVHQAHLFPTSAKLKQLLALVFIVPFLAVFGPVFVAAGSTGVHVTCEHQGDVVNCTVRRTLLFGLVGLTDQATDVSGVRVSTPSSKTHRRRRTLVTAVQLTTASGHVPLTLGASNTNHDEKRRLADAVSTFLDSPAVPRLDLRQSFSNVFLLFGIPFTAL
ncbi:MAG TPA: hypothetical protein VJ787_08115, partial [Thermoleophilia bacterium]|nr:hypothetical protein [Thermoleophilia bacterium]